MMEEKIATHILEYFSTLDNVIGKISNLNEGKLAKLPNLYLMFRKIKVGITRDHKGAVVNFYDDP